MFSAKQQLILDEVDYETIGECIVEFCGIDPRFGTLSRHSAAFSFCCISSDDRLIVSASKDRTLKIWDVESGSLLRTLEDLLPEWIPLGLLGRVKRIDVNLGNLGELPVRQVGLEPARPVPEPLPRREV